MRWIKVCSKCLTNKNLDQFGLVKRGKDRLRSVCKDCRKKYASDNREAISAYKKTYYIDHKDEIDARQNAWNALNKQEKSRRDHDSYQKHQEKRLETIREYNFIHAEEISSWQKGYYSENVDECRERMRSWRINNPEKANLGGHRYRARKVGATVEVVPNDIKQLMFNCYGEMCMYPNCDKDIIEYPLQLDHIVPISRGGPHAVDNLQILCKWHNSSKGNRNTIDYRTQMEVNA